MSLTDKIITLDTSTPIWEQFFMVHPLVIIGTKELDGNYDLSPKHMATPLGWENYFACVGTPNHHTYQNIKREGVFTVSYPKPSQIISASLSASMREKDDSKPILSQLPTFPATKIDSVFLQESNIYLECETEKIIDGFGVNSLIIGKIIAAHVEEDSLRVSGQDDNDLIFKSPLLSYLHPERFATINQSQHFPFPIKFKK